VRLQALHPGAAELLDQAVGLEPVELRAHLDGALAAMFQVEVFLDRLQCDAAIAATVALSAVDRSKQLLVGRELGGCGLLRRRHQMTP
jgi:hypothetical protein